MEVGQLARAKDNFVELMANQKSMNDKLNTIEQRSLLIKEEVELNRQKNHNNYVVAYVSRLLSELSSFIGSKEALSVIDQSSLKKHQGSVSNLDKPCILSALSAYNEAITEALNKMQKEKSQVGPKIQLDRTVEAIFMGYRTIKINLEGLSLQYG